jgi:hypothetical protein
MQGFLAKTVKPPLLAGKPDCRGDVHGSGNRRLQGGGFDPKRRFRLFWRLQKQFHLICRLPMSQNSSAAGWALASAARAGVGCARPVNLVPTRNEAGWNAMSRGIKS